MKKLIGIVCGVVVGCMSILAFAGSDRYVAEYFYDCSGYVQLKDGHGGFKEEKLMSASCKADDDEQAQGKFKKVFTENGNRVNDPVECHKPIQN